MANRRVVVELGGGLVTLYEDGSIQRRHSIPVPSSQGTFVDGVASIDVTLNDTTGVWARIFVPNPPINDDAENVRLPIVVHFHGGGFSFGSPSDPAIHSFCCRMSLMTKSIWFSVAYRLAPEHRLPAGCDDCIEAIAWLNRVSRREVDSPWLSRHWNLEHCFLAGESVGSDLAHQVALCGGGAGQGPVKIIGMILIHPTFVKEEKSRSEMENSPEVALVRPADTAEQVAKLALPEGRNMNYRQYYIFNPWIPHVNQLVLPPALVILTKLDLYYDPAVEYCRAMEAGGQDIEVVEYAKMGHCMHLMKKYEASPDVVDQNRKVVNFINKRLQILQGPMALSRM